MSDPLVAVAMPTYNHAAYIDEAISSVLAQTYGAWELVIVDDGSTDETVEIARRHANPRITIVTGEHRGLERLREAYQAVLDRTSAPLVAILEGDDRWPADKLARQIRDFEDQRVVLSYGAGTLIDEHGCEYGLVRPGIPADDRTNDPPGAIVPALLEGNPILAPTVVVRRSALDAVGGFWQPTGVPYVDHPTWLLLAGQGTFVYHEDVVGSWRRHSAQWTTRAVHDRAAIVPEALYLREAIARLAMTLAAADGMEDVLSHERRHRDRAVLNRWRLALLAGTGRDVAARLPEIVATRRPRLIALAVVGLASWLAGSDLEWIQVRRHRVAWPSRRHRRSRP